MSDFNPADQCGLRIQSLLSRAPCNELGPGHPDHSLRDAIAAVVPLERTVPGPLDSALATACAAGLWLRFDFFEESHALSQSLDTPEGSYWHGILHRREPDYANAKYWFRQVKAHPIFPRLAEKARQLAAGFSSRGPVAFIASQPVWRPLEFVDFCQAAQTGDEQWVALARQIQLAEWELLFDFCFQRAVGR